MTITQKQVLRELLSLSIQHGFGSLYLLAPIAEKLQISEPLYDNNTNTGLLWEFGPHGNGTIFAQGDWPDSYAGLYYDMATIVENWTHRSSEPVG